MRNYSVLFTILVIFSLSISCRKEKETFYHPFVEQNKIWSNGTLGYSNSDILFSPFYSFYIKIGNDTLLNNQKWSKIFESWDENHERWTFSKLYIREQNRQVYIKSSSNGMERLMYDFNLKAGDQIKLWVNAIAVEADFIVDSVKLLPLEDNIKRTHLYIHPQWSPDEKIIWIEGIGSVNGFYRISGMYYLIGILDRLICFEEDDVQIYKDTMYGSDKCFFQDIGKSGKSDHLIH
jgi:hypothetical protein